MPVENQKHFHRQMTDSLVAIEERMVANQREYQGRGFRWQAWIQILPTESHLRLNDRRLKSAEIAHSIKPTGLF